MVGMVAAGRKARGKGERVADTRRGIGQIRVAWTLLPPVTAPGRWRGSPGNNARSSRGRFGSSVSRGRTGEGVSSPVSPIPRAQRAGGRGGCYTSNVPYLAKGRTLFTHISDYI